MSFNAKFLLQLTSWSGKSLVNSYHGHLCSWLELEIRRKDIAHNIVVVSPFDQPLSLHACVYGGPAVFITTGRIFHESPHRAVPHWHWALVREN